MNNFFEIFAYFKDEDIKEKKEVSKNCDKKLLNVQLIERINELYQYINPQSNLKNVENLYHVSN